MNDFRHCIVVTLWCGAIFTSLQLPASSQTLTGPTLQSIERLDDAPAKLLVLSDQETYPNAKTLASEVALALTTYQAGEDATAIIERLPGEAAAVKEAVAALHHPDSWSRARVIYPQLGGMLPDRASVMVIVEQQIGNPEGVRIETRTIDVRLRLVDGVWRFEDVASFGGAPIAQPANLSPEALAVLGHPNIAMPDSARWDIYSGAVSTTLLGLMTRLADRTPIGVVTLVTGHPWEIFGTNRKSDHTRGVAVDLYAIGDRLIVEDRATGSERYAAAEWLSRQPEVARLGSPWRFDDATAITFTDALHQDHFHIAVPRDAP
jgi:hypothetical protein